MISKKKRAPRGATFMSIFGVPEAEVANLFIKEGRATKISKKDTRRAGAPMVNEAGHKLMFSVSVKNADMEEFNARVGAIQAWTPDNNIKMYFHCAKCLREKPGDTSPRDWAQLECGWTIAGFQVWCKRHECNVMHINFQGVKHPAITGVARAPVHDTN